MERPSAFVRAQVDKRRHSTRRTVFEEPEFFRLFLFFGFQLNSEAVTGHARRGKASLPSATRVRLLRDPSRVPANRRR